jgi:hypothetical protein
MCQLIVEDVIESGGLLVAPISQISLERGQPIGPQIAAHERRGVSQWKCDSPRRASA